MFTRVAFPRGRSRNTASLTTLVILPLTDLLDNSFTCLSESQLIGFAFDTMNCFRRMTVVDLRTGAMAPGCPIEPNRRSTTMIDNRAWRRGNRPRTSSASKHWLYEGPFRRWWPRDRHNPRSHPGDTAFFQVENKPPMKVECLRMLPCRSFRIAHLRGQKFHVGVSARNIGWRRCSN